MPNAQCLMHQTSLGPFRAAAMGAINRRRRVAGMAAMTADEAHEATGERMFRAFAEADAAAKAVEAERKSGRSWWDK